MIFFLEPNLYLTTFGSVRQAAANAIAVYAVSLLLDKKETKFIRYSFIAFLFHKSAAILVIIYLIEKLKIYNKKNIYLITFISLLVTKKMFLTFLVNLFGYSGYLEGRSLAGYKIGIIISLYILFCIFIKNEIKEDKDRYLCYLVYLGGLIYILTIEIPAANRITRYFIYFVPAIFSNYLKYIKLNRNKIIYKAVIYIYFCMFFILFLFISKRNIETSSFLPYKMYFMIEN